jgi:NADH-quinone oxidoreductase subunit H
VLALGSLLIPEKQRAAAKARRGPEVIDPFAAGYPVPPMPGQVLPPSPRKERAAVAAGAAAARADDAGPGSDPTTPEVHGG